jgi:hypothetical protein
VASIARQPSPSDAAPDCGGVQPAGRKPGGAVFVSRPHASATTKKPMPRMRRADSTPPEAIRDAASGAVTSAAAPLPAVTRPVARPRLSGK